MISQFLGPIDPPAALVASVFFLCVAICFAFYRFSRNPPPKSEQELDNERQQVKEQFEMHRYRDETDRLIRLEAQAKAHEVEMTKVKNTLALEAKSVN